MAAFALLGQRLRLLDQPPRPSEDPLWLAASLPDLVPHATVLDAGCGSGVLALASRIYQPDAAIRLTLLDQDVHLTHLAANNATINRQPARMHTADFLTLPASEVWDVILSNPPFHQQARGHTSQRRAVAHSAPPGLLEDWLRAALRHTSPAGQVHMVVHTQALPLLHPMCHGCAVIVTPVQTREGSPAKRALLHLFKNRPTRWQVYSALPVWQAELRERTLRQAVRLPLPFS